MPEATTPTTTGRVHVLAMRARNIKCVREVAIDLSTGDIHEIRGDAGQGKTACLEALEGALRGLDPDMITNGQDSAEIQLDLSVARINRIIPREGKETVMVTDPAGQRIEPAKAFLATIAGPSAFRPIEWVRLGGGESRGRTERLRRQRDQLLEALHLTVTAEQVATAVRDLGADHARALRDVNLEGVDFDQHPLAVCSEIERLCYDRRAGLNTRVDDAEARLKLVPPPDKAPPQTDLATCEAAERQAVQTYYEANARAKQSAALRERHAALKARVEMNESRLDEKFIKAELGETAARVDCLSKLVEELQTQLNEAMADLETARGMHQSARTQQQNLEAHQSEVAQLADLEQAMADAEIVDEGTLERLNAAAHAAREATERRRAQDAYDAAAKAAQEARTKSEIFDALVKLFRDDLPKELLAQADLPVEGLSIDGDKILINGVPLHQLGTSDQIRVGVAIAAALNPHAGFVLVDGAESMGTADRIALAEAAQSLDLQLIMTFVDPDAQPAPGRTVMRAGQAVEPSAN